MFTSILTHIVEDLAFLTESREGLFRSGHSICKDKQPRAKEVKE